MGWQNITFNQIIVQGSNAGIFIYNGTPGLGTLIGSWAAVAGIDAYGNAYPQGLYVATAATINNATLVNALLSNAIITTSQFNQGTVFESVITFDSTAGGLFLYAQTQTTITLTSSSTSWTAPAGTYTTGDVTVWASGASGAGGVQNSYSGAGGGGGGMARTPNYPMTAGDVFNVVIPTGGVSVGTGSAGLSGNAATFDFNFLTGPSVRASGGTANTSTTGGHGGQPVVGTFGFNGGNGGNASFKNTSLSGGGGGSAGQSGPGGNGGQDGPAGSAGAGGGATGGSGVSENQSGHNGGSPGAGGSGSGYSTGGFIGSGVGADGKIVIVLNTAVPQMIGGISAIANQADAGGNTLALGFTGPITAIAPGSSPAIPETWHVVTLDTGWTAVGDGIQYRLNADGTVQCFGAATHAAFTGGTVINSSNPVATVYRPTRTRNIGGAGIPNRAGCEITSGGVFTAEANGVSCTETDLSGFYPLY
jgi:hypothetical protein